MSLRRASRLAFAALWLLPGVAELARAGTDPLSAQVQGVFQQSARAVVKIDAEDDDGPLSGTGFFIDPNGTIYTNYSVGGNSRDIFVSYGGQRYPAACIGADQRSGLAILTIDPAKVLHCLAADQREALELPKQGADKTPFLPMGKADDLSVGSMVMSVGYPLDLPITPSVGCVGGFGISYGNRYFAVSHIRASVPVERGEAGAPLLNMDGEVVGILESSLDSGAGCFVLPIEAAEKVRSDIVRFGEVRPGWLGIRFDRSDEDGGQIIVQGFVQNSPAEKSGLQPGDVIVKVGEKGITKLEDVLNAAFFLTAEEEVPLTVSRNGQTMVFKVMPGPSPLAPQEQPTPASIFNLSVQLLKQGQ